jgi:hypothetical protein
MKRIFTLSAIMIAMVAILAGCVKHGYDYGYDDQEDYWLSQESGDVVYADQYCPYYVVETNSGYTIIRATNGYAPYEGTVIYGDLSRRGSRDLYDYNDDVVIRGEITDYWLSYADAQYIIDNLCYSYNRSSTQGTTAKKAIIQGTRSKK